MMEYKVVSFCNTPRSLKDVCLEYGMVSSVGYDLLKRLVEDGILKEVYQPETGAILFQTT